MVSKSESAKKSVSEESLKKRGSLKESGKKYELVKQKIVDLMFRGDAVGSHDSDSDSDDECDDECECKDLFEKMKKNGIFKNPKCDNGWGCEALSFYNSNKFLDESESMVSDWKRECKKELKKTPKDKALKNELEICCELEEIIKVTLYE